jgi:hypothetical protein
MRGKKDPVRFENVEVRGHLNPQKRKIRGLFGLQGHPKLQEKLYFGKYYKQKIEDVAAKDYEYLKWIYEQPVVQKSSTTKKSIEFYLKKYSFLDKK